VLEPTPGPGDYVEQWCALCERRITKRDVQDTSPEGGVQVLYIDDIRVRVHRRCYFERYQRQLPDKRDRPGLGSPGWVQADFFDCEETLS